MLDITGKLRRWSARTKLTAVSDDDLEPWLQSLGILDALRAGRMRCDVCGDVVTLETLQLVGCLGGELRVSCEKPRCIYVFSHRQIQRE